MGDKIISELKFTLTLVPVILVTPSYYLPGLIVMLYSVPSYNILISSGVCVMARVGLPNNTRCFSSGMAPCGNWEHDNRIKWKHFPRYWPFVRGIHQSPVNFPHKGQWCGALIFPLIYVWTNSWVNNRDGGDFRRRHAHYDVTVMNTVEWRHMDVMPYPIFVIISSLC